MLIDGNYNTSADSLIILRIMFINQAQDNADQSVQKRSFLLRPARLEEIICCVTLRQQSSSNPRNKIRGRER